MAEQIGQQPAFYFDEFPSSPAGDFNGFCRAEFQERYGYAMPDEPTRDVLAFNQVSVCLYVCLSVCLSVGVSVGVCLSIVCLLLAPSVYLLRLNPET